MNLFPMTPLYSSTKGAFDNLDARGLAVELAPRKIRVNAINPGHTETEEVCRGVGLRQITLTNADSWNGLLELGAERDERHKPLHINERAFSTR